MLAPTHHAPTGRKARRTVLAGSTFLLLVCLSAALAVGPGCSGGSGGTGNPTWAKSYGAQPTDSAAAAAALPDGGFVIVADRDGTTKDGHPTSDAWLIGVDTYGDPQWQRLLGRQAGWRDRSVAVPAPLGGAFFVTNEIFVDGDTADLDVSVTYLNGTGGVVWQRRYSLGAVQGERLYFADERPADELRDARPTRDGGLVFAAVSRARIDVDPSPDAATALAVRVPWLARLAPNGDVRWQRQFVDEMREYDTDREIGMGMIAEAAGAASGAESDTFVWIASRIRTATHTRLARIEANGAVRWTAPQPDFTAIDGAVSEQGSFLVVGNAETKDIAFQDKTEAQARCFDVDGPDGGGDGRWVESLGGAVSFLTVGVAPSSHPASSGFVGILSGGETNRILWLRENDGGTIGDRPIDPALFPFGSYPVVVPRVDGEGRFSDIYLGKPGFRRATLDWQADEGEDLSILDLGLGGLGYIRTAAGETCLSSFSGRLQRLDATLATIWETGALERGDGPHRERALDVHVLPADPRTRQHAGCILVGAWEVEKGGFAPWIVRVDARGIPLWSRLSTAADPPPITTTRIVASTMLGDGSVVVAQRTSGSTVRLTRFLPDGSAAWQRSVEARWLALDFGRVLELGSAGPSSFALTSANAADGIDIQTFDSDGRSLLSYRVSMLAAEGEFKPFPRACVIDARGVLIVGSLQFLEPHLFVVDIAPDGTVRSASSHPWDAHWRLSGVRVSRGAGGEAYIAATIDAEMLENFVIPYRKGGCDWLLMRVGAEGTWEWAQAYGGLLAESLSGLRAVPGGALLVGVSESVEVHGDAWALRVGPDGHISAGGGCQAELERVDGGEALPLAVNVVSRTPSDAAPALPPFDDIIEVVTPSFPVTDTVVARQCFGFSTPEPSPEEPPPGGGGGPAGNGILFAGNDAADHDKEIWSIPIEGGAPTQRTDNDWNDLDPAWSPDGTRIAFVCDEGKESSFELYVMNADGSGREKLSDFRATNLSAATPAWSTDGARIVVVLARDGFGEGLRIITVATKAVEVLTSQVGDRAPAWAPGSRILFARNDGIYAVSPGGAPQLLYATIPIGAPAWSPDATRIAFAQYVFAATQTRLAVMNADGSNVLATTSGGVHPADFAPAWLPGGTRLVYIREELTGDRLWTTDANGTNQNAALLPGQVGDVASEPDAR